MSPALELRGAGSYDLSLRHARTAPNSTPGLFMRLKPEKIQQLAELVHDSLAQCEELTLNGERDKLVFEIQKIITEDLEDEVKIEEEARQILDKHADDIRRMSVSYDQMLRKTMKKLANDRGMII